MAETAKYSLKFESNAAQTGAEGASALEQLREKVVGADQAIRTYGDSLRRLKGSSDEIKAAKADLKAKLDAEKTAMSQATLEILKAGTSYTKLTEEHKKLAAEAAKGAADKLRAQSKGLGDALQQAAAPTDQLKTKTAELGTGLDLSGKAMTLLAGAATMAVAAVVAVGAAFGSLTVKLSTFILESGNILRTQELNREAFLGNALAAEHLGNQIDELGKKVPMSRAALNDMGNDLVQAGVKGKTLVDTLNAVAQTSSALNATAGNKIKEFVERGRLSGRFALGQLELQGTGLQFADVAQALATNTKTSVAEASAALMQGQVTLGAGAEAIRTAVEKRFGKTNLAKMLDLDVLKQKFSDTFAVLTKDVNLEPLLESLQDIMTLFDTSTESGSALKELITAFGGGMVDSITAAKPAVKGFIEELILGALDLQLDYLNLKIQFVDTFGKDTLKNLDVFSAGVDAAKIPVKSLEFFAGRLMSELSMITTIVQGFKDFETTADSVHKKLAAMSWADVGISIAKGILEPLKSIPASLETLGNDMVKSIRKGLDSHSPSKKMEAVGDDATGGVAQGVQKGRAKLDAAMGASAGGMVNAARGSSSGASGGLGAPPIHIEINYSGSAKKDELDDLKTVVRNAVADALEIANRQAGLAGAPA